MSQSIYPADFAAMLVKCAGEKYRPSNGTEGQLFLDAFCRRCQRDGAMRSGANVEDCDDEQRCDIIGLTMIHEVEAPEYPTAWQYGRDGQPCCTQFVPAGQPIPEPRCTHTQELEWQTSLWPIESIDDVVKHAASMAATYGSGYELDGLGLIGYDHVTHPRVPDVKFREIYEEIETEILS